MCNDGTCYSCRKAAQDQSEREATYAFRWRSTPQKTPKKKVVDATTGDPLDVSFLNFEVIRKLLSQGEEGGKKGKEQ